MIFSELLVSLIFLSCPYVLYIISFCYFLKCLSSAYLGLICNLIMIYLWLWYGSLIYFLKISWSLCTSLSSMVHCHSNLCFREHLFPKPSKCTELGLEKLYWGGKSGAIIRITSFASFISRITVTCSFFSSVWKSLF